MSDKPNRRHVVKLVASSGQTDLVFEDGHTERLVFNGGDVEYIDLHQATPRGDCQRCGHARTAHGDWDWDGEDEIWTEHRCEWSEDCACEQWIPFTPWYEQKVAAT